MSAFERAVHEAAQQRVWELVDQCEPACWSWPIPTVADIELYSRSLPPEVSSLIGRTGLLWILFHDERCAICSQDVRGQGVTDHDHGTGMVRGVLCRSCNTLEGVSPRALFAKYRSRNPASILGYIQCYSDGFGFEG
jgi:hypothetical protein